MSKLSIYETDWINLVFENKNKEYGAYQLRQESSRTSLFALFIALLLCASLMGIPPILSFFNVENNSPAEIQEPLDRIIQVTTIAPPLIKKIEAQIPVKTLAQKSLEVNLKKQLVNPVIVEAPLATPDLATNNEYPAIIESTNTGIGLANPNSSVGNGTEITTPIEYGNTVVTTAILDKLPEFPGGIAKFYTYIGRNFETPDINGERTVRIYVSFVVEKDGSMTSIQVKNDPGYGLADEAIRVLKSLKTNWAPGMIGSKPVRTSYNLPIMVQGN
ncbi:energy transducer TonB [Flavobacterium frigoris]|uniref:Ferric siderophore transport system, periplasmic binding protein TonB n=1 Tax=Flavobacterium frigoris (strain PS1) TaxID=1086011 RepID=H7FM04_FLAFP|nr:energy transducer TonB [Flavobacterium frigoris]EIA10462.1 ferric siderophore transport system, periplasmic binding protein TonB [Flavobacterium frigoris PS1]